MSDSDPASHPLAGRTPVGARLHEARTARGLSLDEVAARTRIPLRHLEAIEHGNFTALPSITYAMGFAKAYARTVGVDEVKLGRDLREELGSSFNEKPEYVPYEVSDPMRVPPRGLAWVGALVALLVILGAALWYGTTMFGRGEVAPAEQAAAPAAAPPPGPVAAAAAPTVDPAGEQVTLVANGEVWVRVYDADNRTLLVKTMTAGERYDVPRDANNPMINIGRPDQITVTINGSQVAPLGPPERAITNVGISAEALRARATAPDAGAAGGAAG